MLGASPCIIRIIILYPELIAVGACNALSFHYSYYKRANNLKQNNNK